MVRASGKTKFFLILTIISSFFDANNYVSKIKCIYLYSPNFLFKSISLFKNYTLQLFINFFIEITFIIVSS